MTVVVVDDDPASRALLRETLEMEGCRVVDAANGAEATHIIEMARPTLVVLDLKMPGLDGFAVLDQLRTNPNLASIRIVACTAYAMAGDRERALAAGFDEYLTKPLRVGAIRGLITPFRSDSGGPTGPV